MKNSYWLLSKIIGGSSLKKYYSALGVTQTHYSWLIVKRLLKLQGHMVAEVGFEPTDFGLWDRRDTASPLCDNLWKQLKAENKKQYIKIFQPYEVS